MTTRMMMAEDFVRLFAMRSSKLAWFFGAGASAAAGVPTAGNMIADFKASLFASAHKIARREIDADDPVWASRIDRYFDGANGFSASGDPSDYQIAFERMYPEARDRRTYIDQQTAKGNPSFGHLILAALISSRQMPLAFTTNFDDLIEQAARWADGLLSPDQRVRLAVSALNSTDVAERCLRESDWPLLAKIHGDFQSLALKNTQSELRDQDEILRRVMLESTRRFGLVVVGYSGRDESVMHVLEEALATEDPFPAGLYWVSREGSPILPRVSDLLQRASAAGVEAFLVHSETFDELFAEIERQVRLPDALARAVMAARPATAVVDVAVPTAETDSFPALRFSALVVESWPRRCRSVRLKAPPDDLRKSLRDAHAKVEAMHQGHNVLAFGSDRDLRAALSVPEGEWDPQTRTLDLAEDTAGAGLVYAALTRALTRSRPLHHDFRAAGHSLHLRDPAGVRDVGYRQRLDEQLKPMKSVYGPDLYGEVPDLGRKYAEGVRLRLEWRLGRWWLLFQPFTWVQRPSERLRPDPVTSWLRERWVRRRNIQWAAIIEAWAQLLAPEEPTELRAWWLGDGDGIDAAFMLGKITGWSRPGDASAR